jgi:DNA-binding GntR family transcriptional regulator
VTPPREHGAAAAHVADLIREAIIRGEYPPRARIRQEELALESGASRVPVREALRMLEAEGLVTLVANTGAWVSSLSLGECQEIYRVRERVEPAAQMADSDDPEAFLELDRAFHLLTYTGTQTVVLTELVHRLWNRTQAYRRVYTGLMDARARRTVHDEHRLIVGALRDHDIDAAESMLAGHIRRTRRQLASHPEVFAEREERL